MASDLAIFGTGWDGLVPSGMIKGEYVPNRCDPRLSDRAPIEEKSSVVLRHCRTLIGSNEWLSSACASSVSNGGQRPVVPNVPLRVARPARPAICASSAGLRLRN